MIFWAQARTVSERLSINRTLTYGLTKSMITASKELHIKIVSFSQDSKIKRSLIYKLHTRIWILEVAALQLGKEF